jgi:tetratricopeptide (TPR) repeat protein
MAPEQAAGDSKNVGVPADVYSLGAILYELLTGRPPFQGATPLSVAEQVRDREPVPPRRRCWGISLDLQTICLKCLEKDPAKRYPSAEALADDLGRFLDGQPIQARPVPLWQRLWRAARRRPARLAWTLAALTLIGLLLAAWSYFGAADELGLHRAEAKYRQFVQKRNEALVYGLLAPDQGSQFLGVGAATHWQTAESAVHEALALGGVEAGAPGFPVARKKEVASDCYTLLLVWASLRAQQELPGQPKTGPYRAALRILDQARQLGFQTRAYYLRRAHLREQLGEHEQARRDRDQAESLPPQGALDHFLLGEEQYRRGEWPQAMSSFNDALSKQPGHFWAGFFLAVCQLKQHEWKAAKAGFTACLAQQPDFVWGYLFRSFANERLKALDEAQADFARALELDPNDDARYALLLTRGIFFFNQQALERAAADFQAAQDLKPEQSKAYLNLAHVNLAQGQFDQAAQQIQAARQRGAPPQAVAGYHLERGRRLLKDKKYDAALEACAAALELVPQLPRAQEIRGRALLALERFGEAEKSFDQSLRLGGPPETDLFRARGLARMKLGKYLDAVDDYTRALDLERTPDADIYQHRGWAHFFADAWKLALRDFSRALEVNPDVGDAHTGRGLARVMLGQYREAVADADEALRRKPQTPEMMHNIACIFAQAVARAEADSAFSSSPTAGGNSKVTGQKDRQSLADSYRRRAMEAVRQTLSMLRPQERAAFWRNKILPDAALAPIRDTADFRRLQAEYDRR